MKVSPLKILKPDGGKVDGAPCRLWEFSLLLVVMENIVCFLKDLRLIFLVCTFFVIYDASAEDKMDDKSPHWVAGVCGKLELLAWDKFNSHPPYQIKYIVRHSIYTYSAEKLSSNVGTAFHAVFPEDFVDSTGRAARLTTPCISDEISYEIYGDGTRIESGRVNVDYKVND